MSRAADAEPLGGVAALPAIDGFQVAGLLNHPSELFGLHEIEGVRPWAAWRWGTAPSAMSPMTVAMMTRLRILFWSIWLRVRFKLSMNWLGAFSSSRVISPYSWVPSTAGSQARTRTAVYWPWASLVAPASALILRAVPLRKVVLASASIWTLSTVPWRLVPLGPPFSSVLGSALALGSSSALPGAKV